MVAKTPFQNKLFFLSQPVPVSQICALMVFASTWMLLVVNSTPMVDFDSRLNSFLVKRDTRFDFPTPESPMRTTVKGGLKKDVEKAGSVSIQRLSFPVPALASRKAIVESCLSNPGLERRSGGSLSRTIF